MNESRVAHNLQPLGVDPALQKAARAHVKEILRSGVFDHGAFGQRLKRYGVKGRVMAENIAWSDGYRWARSVVAMWLRSPGHRSNLLRPGFHRVGVAVLRGRFAGSKVRVVTADFAGR